MNTPPPRPRRQGRRLLLAAVAVLALAAGAAVAAGLWLARAEAGTRWLLDRVPGLQAEQVSGSLFHGPFQARQLRYAWADGAAGLQLDQLSWDSAQWSFTLFGPRWFTLQLGELAVQEVRVRTGPTSAERLRQPDSLRLPFELKVQRLRSDSLRIDALEPVQGLSASVHLGAAQGSRHEVQLLSARWSHLQADGRMQIGSDRPFRVEADVSLAAQGSLPWQARVGARGPLASVDVQAMLRGEPAAGQTTSPTLDAEVQLRPFEAWPLGKATASTRALDLQALWPAAPRTLLSGRALLRGRTIKEPLTAEVDLDNARPARFSEGGLPLHSLHAVLQSDPKQPQRLVLGPFDLQAADSQGAAGRWTGTGVWHGEHLDLQTRLQDLQPQRLDARLAPMRLTGPLALSLHGLPPPDPQAPHDNPRWREQLVLETSASLEGHLGGAPHDVGLDFEAKASASEIDVASLRARSGPARAQLSALAKRGTDRQWHLRSRGELAAFDPALWVAGSEGSAWRKGPHRLNGRWDLDLSLDPGALAAAVPQEAPASRADAATPVLRLANRLRGHARMHLEESRLAGVPLQGDIDFSHGAGPEPGPARARAELKLGSAQLSGELHAGTPGGPDGAADPRLQLRVQAPALAEWAPLAALHPALAAWVPRQGQAELQLDARGRWPALAVDGRARLQGVQAGPLDLGSALLELRSERARGLAGTLKAEAHRVAFGEMRLATARAELRGATDNHRFDLSVSAPVQPPALLAQAFGWKPGAGGQVQVTGSGRWADEADGGRWTAKIERASAGRWDGSANPATDASWLDMRDIQAECSFGPDGAPRGALLQPGQASIGPVVLQWQEASWRDMPGGPDHWRLRANTEPLAVAPLLMRLRPAGASASSWSGDLGLVGRVDIEAGNRLKAEIEAKRHGGDLQFSDGGPPRALGLSEASWQLSVQDGLWRLTPRSSGRTLGQVSGELRVRSTPAKRWPDGNDAVEGELQADVPALEAWATWLPAGWRLQGRADARVRLSGTLAAPAYNGHVEAHQLGVRNLLQGVDLRDGQARLALQGETARLEHLRIRGGDGSLSAEGEARFGPQPRLELRAKASRLRVLGRIDRQLVLSGQVGWEATADRSSVEGQLVADSGLFDLSARDAPTLDDDVAVRRGTAGDAAPSDSPPSAPAAAAEPTARARQTQVAFSVDLGNQLRLRGRGLDTGLAGKLDLGSRGGRLVVNGSVRTQQGTYAAYGQKLDIERGMVSFAGPPDSARLDILALRPNTDVRVGVAITGRAIDPRVRLFSEPEMAETDKLSWLVLGRAPSGLGRADTALLQRAALALWAGEGESPSTGVLRAIGLDELSIRTGDGELRDTVVSVGKQLNRRWYVGYERSVNATSGTWQLIYRAAQRFTLRAQSGEDNSLDMIWTWRFGAPASQPAAAPAATPAGPAASAP